MNPLEYIVVNVFNRATGRKTKRFKDAVSLGYIVHEDGATRTPFFLPTSERARHIIIWGKTGAGKSFFLRYLMQDDIRAGRGFLVFDLHGDTTPQPSAFWPPVALTPPA